MPVIQYLRLFEGWIKSPRTMFIFGAAAGLPLFLPACWLEALHVNEGVSKYRLWFWLIFLICGMGLIFEAGTRILWHFRIRYRLHHLAGDEQEFLSYYIRDNVSTRIFLPVYAGAGESLTADGIVFLSPNIGQKALAKDVLYYTVHAWILRYLRNHPKYLGNRGNSPQNSTQNPN